MFKNYKVIHIPQPQSVVNLSGVRYKQFKMHMSPSVPDTDIQQNNFK